VLARRRLRVKAALARWRRRRAVREPEQRSCVGGLVVDLMQSWVEADRRVLAQ